MYKDKYLKYKNKYLNFKSQLGGDSDSEKNIQYGIAMNKQRFNDKGNNNLWMEPIKGNLEDNKLLNTKEEEEKIIDKTTLDEFEKKIIDIIDKRYYIRKNALFNLFKLMETKHNQFNMDFLNDFYRNLFKGITKKMTFESSLQEKLVANEQEFKNLAKRYRIYSEWIQPEEGELPQQQIYALINDENPCDLVEIINDQFSRQSRKTKEYNFVNKRVLGKGAAGTAYLFKYPNSDMKTKENLSIVAKTMSGLNLTNNGEFLPLQIIYYQDSPFKNIPILDKNKRFILDTKLLNEYERLYPGYRKFNTFKTNNQKYPHVSLAVASDNFTNQTILHMILENIFDEVKKETTIELNNYVRQFDALLCLKSESEFKPPQNTWFDYFKKMGDSAINFAKQTLNFSEFTTSGLTLMQVANGDLYGHLQDVQLKYFSKIREVEDLNNKDDSRFKELHNLYISRDDDTIPDTSGLFDEQEYQEQQGGSEDTYFDSLSLFLDDMITQILKSMHILSSPKYSFVHGDFKSKNVFFREEKAKDGKKRYLYQLADYDKSSILYNGIRFYNEGNTATNFILSKFYPNLIGLSANLNSPGEAEGISVKVNDDQLKHEKFFELITNVLEIKDIDEAYGKFIDSNSSNVDEEKKSLIKLINKNLRLIFKESDYETNKLKDDETNNDIIKDKIKILINERAKTNNYYTINSLISRLSLLVSSLEKVEVEQMYVRYLPTPFYYTIDLYTLFLSLIQSPLVLTFIKYCIKNKDLDKVKNSIFWNSFRDLWVRESDIYILIGYQEYMRINPSIDEDPGTINFILDPIKKNDFYLKKKMENEYWKRVWNSDEFEKIQEFINEGEEREIKLSSGSITLQPQISLSQDCNNSYSAYFARSSKVYMVNKQNGDIIETVPDFGQLISAAAQGTETSDPIIEKEKKKYLTSLLLQIINKLKFNKIQITETGAETTDEYLNNILNKLFVNNLDKIIIDQVNADIDKLKKINSNSSAASTSDGDGDGSGSDTASTSDGDGDGSGSDTASTSDGENSTGVVRGVISVLGSFFQSRGSSQTSLTDKISEKNLINNYWDILLEKTESIMKDGNRIDYDKLKIYFQTDNLESYINNKFKFVTRLTLQDIVKTNKYKDIFGNYINWDYCIYDDKKLIERLKSAFDTPKNFKFVNKSVETELESSSEAATSAAAGSEAGTAAAAAGSEAGTASAAAGSEAASQEAIFKPDNGLYYAIQSLK